MALPSLASLLESIERMAQRYPPPVQDEKGQKARDDLTQLQRSRRSIGSGPRHRMPQSEHTDYLSAPKKKPDRPPDPDRTKLIQMAHRRESERRLAALNAAAKREDKLTQGIVTRARSKMVREKGVEAERFLKAEDEARQKRIVRAAQDQARRAVLAPPAGTAAAAAATTTSITVGGGRSNEEKAVQDVLRAGRGSSPARGGFRLS